MYVLPCAGIPASNRDKSNRCPVPSPRGCHGNVVLGAEDWIDTISQIFQDKMTLLACLATYFHAVLFHYIVLNLPLNYRALAERFLEHLHVRPGADHLVD